MTAALALLLLAQERPGAAVLKRLDALFAAPSLAAFRTEYEAAKRSGAWTIRRWQGEPSVAFGARTRNDWREYSVGFDAGGALKTLSGPMNGFGELPMTDHEDVSSERHEMAARMIREITGEDREVEVSEAMVDENGERLTSFRAYRRVSGYRVIDSREDLTVLGRRGERLLAWGRDLETPRIDAETYGHDRTLPLDRLREIARRRGRGIKLARGFEFAHYLLAIDRIEVALPKAEKGPYRDLAERRIGIPIYHRQEFAPREPGGDVTIDLTFDARNGAPLGTLIGRGRLGRVGKAIPVPESVTYAGVSGALEPLAMRSATPPGERVDLPFGRNVFAARFEPGRGTLWISPGGREPYRAYRPDPALLRRLRSRREGGG